MNIQDRILLANINKLEVERNAKEAWKWKFFTNKEEVKKTNKQFESQLGRQQCCA